MILNSDTENDNKKSHKIPKDKKQPDPVNLMTYNTMDTRKGKTQTWSTKHNTEILDSASRAQLKRFEYLYLFLLIVNLSR